MASNPATEPVALIVTDDPYKSAFFKRTLRALYYIIETADSFTAIDWLKSLQASLIIIDEKALASTWMILAEHIRKLSGYRTTPILLVTNNLKKSFLVQALHAGVNDFLSEPFDQDEVFKRIVTTTESQPVTKKVTLMSKRFKKTPSGQLPKLSLPQRFVMNEDAIREIAKLQQEHPSLCLLLLEVDDIQKFQKEYGSEAAEAIVQAVEVLLKSQQRKLDVLIPQGGGRFLMLLPNTSHRATMAIAEMLRKEAKLNPAQHKGNAFAYSLSIGFVSLDKKTTLSENVYEEFNSLLGKVDKALTKAKKTNNHIQSEEL